MRRGYIARNHSDRSSRWSQCQLKCCRWFSCRSRIPTSPSYMIDDSFVSPATTEVQHQPFLSGAGMPCTSKQKRRGRNGWRCSGGISNSAVPRGRCKRTSTARISAMVRSSNADITGSTEIASLWTQGLVRGVCRSLQTTTYPCRLWQARQCFHLSKT